MALNIELRHLCQRENTEDRWRNSILKQVVRAMCVPKNDLFFAIFCAGLHPCFFLNIKLPLWDIDGASPTHSPKSGWECPHRWRKSLISPDIPQPSSNDPTKICHLDGASPFTLRSKYAPKIGPVSKQLQTRGGNMPQKSVLFQKKSKQPHRWRKSGKGLMMRTGQSSVCKCVCQCQPSLACWGMLEGMRDLRHLCGHSQPDFGEWVGLAPSMSSYSTGCWT